jgi:repressor LexA
MQPLTERQQAILEYIQQAIDEKGYPPTLREIGARMDIRSTNGVSDHLRALERKGYLERIGMKSRALRPTKVGRTFLMQNRDTGDELPEKVIRIDRDDRPTNDAIAIPLFNRIAAGPLSTIDERVERYLHIDPSMLRGGGETFALRVKGESMIEAGIQDGDTLFVRRQQTAARGEIVVAVVGDEATVKRYFPETDHIRLQPENKTMSPIFVRKREMGVFHILGVAVGLFRDVAGIRMM